MLDFWFEFASTYSYPAAMRIEDVAPVLLEVAAPGAATTVTLRKQRDEADRDPDPGFPLDSRRRAGAPC